MPIFATSLLLYCATVLVGNASTGTGIVAVLAAYAVGSRTTRSVTLILGGVATAIVAILSITVSTFGVIDPRVFQIAAGIAVAAALGDSSRSHREFIHAATERAERAEETREAEVQRRVAEERLRIAQDLHDTVAHQISVISLNAGVASSTLATAPLKAQAALGTIRDSARSVLTEIGGLLQYLRTDARPTSAPAPLPGLRDIDALIEIVAEAGLRVEVARSGDLDRVSITPGMVAYRIIQEGLTNAHKHGSGLRASVDITASHGFLTVTIVNPVSSHSPNQLSPHLGGLGLTGIRERVASVRGTISTQPTEDRFTLIATLPLDEEARA